MPEPITMGAVSSAFRIGKALGGGKSPVGTVISRYIAQQAAQAGVVQPPGEPVHLGPSIGVLDGGGISEIPSDQSPVSMGRRGFPTSAAIIAKPILSAIFDGSMGGRPPWSGSTDGAVIGNAAVPSKPWTNPQGQPASYPEWDWETWDRENPNWGGTNTTTEDEQVAVDWGGLANIGIDFLQGQTTGQSFVGPSTMGTPAPLPAQVTVDTRTGQVKPCRRRRRRRLLTPTDLSDLAALSAIVGKGDALKLAVAKAVRR